MERNARVILVVSFLLLTVVVLVLFYNWIAGPGEKDMQQEQGIQFDGSVSGLSIGSEVRYLGVPVGRVNSIALSPGRAGRVDVIIGTRQPLPPAEDLVALLEAQGITGLSVIELRDREAESAPLDVPAGMIPGYPSLFSQLAGSAGRITQSVETTLGRLNSLVSEQTADDLSATISQLRRLSANLAAATEDIDEVMASAGRISRELETTLPDFKAIAKQLDEDVLPAIADAGRSLQSATDSISGTIGDNGEELGQLIEQDLPTLINMTDELARTLQELDALVSNINDEPGALLYGQQVREVEIPRE
jgi:phospholipid/cholesterol/gamma-HCH transport system substrate-binding protein